MSLVTIHSRLSITTLLYVIILCLWGIWRSIRKNQLDGNYWGALAIAEILILVQGVVGGILYFTGLQPERGGMHILYGVVGALGIPSVYTFTKGRNDRKTIIVYTAVLFFNTAIFIRSIATG
jgi:hypothetical protein